MDRQDFLNAVRTLHDLCEAQSECVGCPYSEECAIADFRSNFLLPCEWEVDDEQEAD